MVHIIAFWVLGNFVIFSAPPPTTEDAPMVRISLPKKLVPPPPSAGGSLSMVPLPVTMPPAIITTPSPNITFTVPKVPMPSDAGLSNLGPSPGTGNGANGNSQGNAGDLLGGTCETNTRIAVVLDVSTSMNSFDKAVVDYLKLTYKNARIYAAISAGGVTPPPPTLDPSNIRWTPSGNDYMGSSNPNTPDLYSNAYEALKDNPETLVIITDFEDGYKPNSTAGLLTTLRKYHTRLVILSRELAPYPGLAEYSQESHGSYSLVQTDNTTVTGITPNPNLPECPPKGTPKK